MRSRKHVYCTCSANRRCVDPTRAPLQIHWEVPERLGSRGALEGESESCDREAQCAQQLLIGLQQASLEVQKPAKQRIGQVTIAPINKTFKTVRIIKHSLRLSLFLIWRGVANEAEMIVFLVIQPRPLACCGHLLLSFDNPRRCKATFIPPLRTLAKTTSWI